MLLIIFFVFVFVLCVCVCRGRVGRGRELKLISTERNVIRVYVRWCTGAFLREYWRPATRKSLLSPARLPTWSGCNGRGRRGFVIVFCLFSACEMGNSVHKSWAERSVLTLVLSTFYLFFSLFCLFFSDKHSSWGYKCDRLIREIYCFRCCCCWTGPVRRVEGGGYTLQCWRRCSRVTPPPPI